MEDLKWCINYLKKINNINDLVNVYDFNNFRALLNITMPINLSTEFYKRQDNVLQNELAKRKIIDVSTFDKGISLYKGDITSLKADAIVNACNSQMLGCFVPNHKCIDNAIHTFGGLEVRKDMMDIMAKQGHEEENGKCKVTKGYNLKSKYIFHTVGPIYEGLKQDEIDLTNCYLSCLKKADEMELNSIVFCSLSTGIYGYPINKACRIAIRAAIKYLNEENKNIKRIIFDVFSEDDYYEYSRAIKEIN